VYRVVPGERIPGRVAEDELERIVRLGRPVDADDVEPCPVIPDRRSSPTAEQVEEERTHQSSDARAMRRSGPVRVSPPVFTYPARRRRRRARYSRCRAIAGGRHSSQRQR
jgi:hypothetical protein